MYDSADPRPVELPRLQLRRGNWRIEDARAGFTFDLWITPGAPDRILAEQRDNTGRGWLLRQSGSDRVQLTLNDGRRECSWTSDPGTLEPGRTTHLVTIVDGGPKLILFVADGTLQDGGGTRPYG